MKINSKIVFYVLVFILVNCLFFVGDIISFFQKRSEEAEKLAKIAFESQFETIMVAKMVVHRGEVLTPEHIEEKKIPVKEVKKEYRLAKEVTPDFTKFVVARHIDSGETITQDKLIPKDSKFIDAILRPNHRAVYLSVTFEQIINPGIYPGNRVDINVTSQKTAETEVFMCGVKILDMTNKTIPKPAPDKKDNAPPPQPQAGFIVFEISLDEAERFLSITKNKDMQLTFLPISKSEAEKDVDITCKKQEEHSVSIFRGL